MMLPLPLCREGGEHVWDVGLVKELQQCGVCRQVAQQTQLDLLEVYDNNNMTVWVVCWV